MSPHGRRQLLTAVATLPVAAIQPVCRGAILADTFPLDDVRVGNPDKANPSGGEFVVTWRFTIPRGTWLGDEPITSFRVLDRDNQILWEDPVTPPFLPSPNYAIPVFININPRF